MGLRRGTEIRAGRIEHRRQAPQGADAGQQERIFLRAGSRHRQALFGPQFRDGYLGLARGRQDRPPGAGARGRVSQWSRADVPERAGCAHVAPDVVQPAYRPRVHPRERSAQCVRRPGAQRRQRRLPRRILHDQRNHSGQGLRPEIAGTPVRQAAGIRIRAARSAGSLVFQGLASGDLCAYTADRGRQLTCVPTGSHLGSAPITYSVDGVQYVAVQAGYGGVAIYAPIPPTTVASKYLNQNRIIAFRLDGGQVPKPPERVEPPVPLPPENPASAQVVHEGERLFTAYCSRCHVFGPSITPDLRRIDPAVRARIKNIVIDGERAPNGMGRFSDVLTESDVNAISAYLLDQAWQLYREENRAAVR